MANMPSMSTPSVYYRSARSDYYRRNPAMVQGQGLTRSGRPDMVSGVLVVVADVVDVFACAISAAALVAAASVLALLLA